jgi:hypothetical protein
MPPSTRPLKPEILTDADLQSEAVARNLERLAWLMDRAIPIPGTKLSVGLDAILGLIPGGGDFVCGLIQTGLVLTAVHNYRVPKVVAARMAANVLIDLAIGTVPVLGDAFDAVFKANTRNLKLLGEVRKSQLAGHPMPAAASGWYLAGIGAILISVLLLIFVCLVALAAVVWKAVTG